MRLLLIEDDVILGEGLRDFLRAEGHQVEWKTSLGEIGSAASEPWDVLLVDWHLPDGSGLAWVSDLRARGDGTPVLLLTARDLLGDRIRGLDAGADDYLIKPFAPEELAARLRAIRRRSSGAASPKLQFGGVEVDLSARCAYLNGERADLTAREWAVLEALALRPGRLVAKDDLDRLVIGNDSEVTSNVLEVHISNLRRKLGRSLIETVRGLGYRISP